MERGAERQGPQQKYLVNSDSVGIFKRKKMVEVMSVGNLLVIEFALLVDQDKCNSSSVALKL